MAKQITIAEARDQLSAHVRSAEHGTPVVITRRGRAVAAIVAADDFERLERLRAAGPQAGLAGLAGGWEVSDVAHVYGRRCAALARDWMPLADANLQIAATALRHHLDLVTGDLRHFVRVPELRVRPLHSST